MESKAADILTQLLSVLDSGAVTPYEFSGVARTALSKALCDDGMAWAEADKRAAEIVDRVCGQGVERPRGDTDSEPRAKRSDEACEQCGGVFHPLKPTQRFCCWACLQEHKAAAIETVACVECGNEFERKDYERKEACSRSCAAKHRWIKRRQHKNKKAA